MKKQNKLNSEKTSESSKNNKVNQRGKNHRRGFNPSMKGKQGRKDSQDPRINLDNVRESKVINEIAADSRRRDANDISDFNRNPELLKSAGSLPFAQILGNKYGNTGATVPGIMTIVWEPGVGLGKQPVAYNKAMQQVYSYIVHANSRNYKYEYTDLAILIHAGIEVFTAIAEAIRVYGVIKYYPEKNRYLADGLVKALGFNPDNIRKNLGQMWFDINNLIMQTKQIWIPDVFPLLHRWIRYNTYIYTDAPGDRSQIYAFVRNQYYAFNETASTTGSCLTPTTIIQTETSTGNTYARFTRSKPTINSNGSITSQSYYTGLSWGTFRDMIQRMIDNLVLSQDRGMIYGDILKAYGEERIFAMKEIPVDYTVTPQYNAEILMQIENTTTFPTFIGGGFYQSDADKPIRLYQAQDKASTIQPAALTVVPGAPKTQMLNMHMPSQPTPEAIMIATRMKTGVG